MFYVLFSISDNENVGKGNPGIFPNGRILLWPNFEPWILFRHTAQKHVMLTEPYITWKASQLRGFFYWLKQAQSSGSTAAAGPVSSCAQVWERMTFAQDEGGKVTAKFRKLMGIRTEPPKDPLPPTEADPLLSRQEKLFQDLDQQYEAARMSTHTHRGVGLGYSSQMAAFFQQTNLTK